MSLLFFNVATNVTYIGSCIYGIQSHNKAESSGFLYYSRI